MDSRPVDATAWLIVVWSAPVGLGDQARQRPEIGVEELRVLAPLLDHADDLVLAPDRAEDTRVGRVARLAFAARGEAELLEQDPPDLRRGAEHELLAGELVRARLELLHPVGKASGDLAHAIGVDLDADVLHRREHLGQRQLDLPVEALGAPLGQAFAHPTDQPARKLGAPDERGRLLLGRRVEQHVDAVLGREVVELVGRSAGLDQVGREQRVVGNAAHPLRLGVVDDELAFDARRSRADHDLVLGREGGAPVLDGVPSRAFRHDEHALPPGHGNALANIMPAKGADPQECTESPYARVEARSRWSVE